MGIAVIRLEVRDVEIEKLTEIKSDIEDFIKAHPQFKLRSISFA